MSKLLRSLWRRVVTRYNVERRVEKVLDSKPKTAPKYKADEERVSKPIKKQEQPNVDLLSRLDKISLQRTSSSGDPDLPNPVGKREKLPQRPEALQPRQESRSTEDLESYGSFAKEDVPAGKLSLKMVMTILTEVNSIQTREKWQKLDDEKRLRIGEEVCKRYKVEAADVAKLTEFLGLFLVHVPESQKQRVQIEPVKLRNSPVSKLLATDVSLKQATQNLPPKTRLAETESQSQSGSAPAPPK